MARQTPDTRPLTFALWERVRTPDGRTGTVTRAERRRGFKPYTVAHGDGSESYWYECEGMTRNWKGLTRLSIPDPLDW